MLMPQISIVKKLFAFVILPALALSACTTDVAGKRADTSPAAQRVDVRTIPVELKDLRRNVEAVGSLFPLEEVTVSSEVEGKVDEVLVDVGDRVESGQPIVRV